ncbi:MULTISPECIES: MFS transporter [Flavobacteriaceae]|jgi:fucose permease|uniref:MFS transporter n=4 Tax=Flagellimonas TaxID=444459 RepID=A0A3A1NKR8_9FLAO|nr:MULTISPECIES: MFS transporter [Flavobacteriaceae]UBZ14395.1 MFS transporter [Allomuricauda aquimarina]KAB5484257.1 sugar MFS transporter [Allomuricauda hadalis]MBA80280.1 MFS transporter [Leeuwenhoekiella sp.]MBO0356077.1 MFS transporter [Allomuricauda aurea]RIV44782.1 MFS transporter [Allomuricauda maritima]
MEHNKATTKRYFHIIGLVMIVFFVISFITNILNSIIVDVKGSFDLSLTLTGLLPFTFFIAYGIMSIPAGFLSERFSEKTLLSVSFLVMAIASMGFALTPQYSVFSITLFILGCCMAVLQVIINPMLRVAGGEEHFAFNSVLAQLVFGSASFLSPYLYKYLVNKEEVSNDMIADMLRGWVPEDLPWASLYIVFAGISLLLFFYVFFTKYPKFEKTEEERAGDKSSYWDLLKNKWTLLYFIGMFCYVGTEQGVGNWISQFLSEYHGLDPQTTGADTVSYFWAMLTVGCLLGLLLLKFMDSRKLLIFATSITIVCLILALTGSSQMALIGFPMVGFFISVMYSIIVSLALNSVKEHHGSLSGILCTGIAGGAVIPFMVGGLGEMLTLKSGMFFLILPLAFILSIGFWAKPLVNNKTISLKKEQ